MFGLTQLSVFGEASPFVSETYLQFRDDSDATGPSHPEAGPSTLFNIFSSPFTFGIFGDLGQVGFGNGVTPSVIDQEYIALGPSLSRIVGNHEFKVGFDYLNTKVDGQELSTQFNQLFATEDNFIRFGAGQLRRLHLDRRRRPDT